MPAYVSLVSSCYLVFKESAIYSRRNRSVLSVPSSWFYFVASEEEKKREICKLQMQIEMQIWKTEADLA